MGLMSLPLRQTAPQPADGELASRVRSGDSAALGLLYQRHAGMLVLLADRLLGRRADAEDVVQDLFVGLPEALRTYRDEGRLAAWLRRIVVNLALKRMRGVRRRREAGLETAGAGVAAPGTGDGVNVRRAVDALPEALRTVVVLKVVEGYSHTEIGELLGITRGASEVRLSRALERLRRSLGESR
jgi:RNA polymerase sigma-70 factor, ECF subfamily